jgi:hypothetical protein
MSTYFAPSIFKLTSVASVLPASYLLGVDINGVGITNVYTDVSTATSAPANSQFGSAEIDFTGVTAIYWHTTHELLTAARTIFVQLWDGTHGVEIASGSSSTVGLNTVFGTVTTGLPTGPILVQIRYKSSGSNLNMRGFRDGVSMTLT